MLSNYPIRSSQNVWRYRQTDLLGRLEIDDEFELCRLLDGKIRGLGAFQDLVDVCSGTTVQVGDGGPVGHQSTGFHKLCCPVDGRQFVLYR